MDTVETPLVIDVRDVRYGDPADAAALVELLDAYARDPMGGGEPLSAYAREHLAAELSRRPSAFSVIAWVRRDGEEHAAGLVNCLEGFSTFACRPLVNVHDVAVRSEYRGLGIARRMLARVEALARARGACKLTLEVLSGNGSAIALYRRAGFADYAIDLQAGTARFMQKWLDPRDA
ncbi:N-acetyltransferase [Ramlibacter sp. H39-3-26]|uniref:GNAT family N-acetyltransferase n=1 Tax=Curvibacter soli TaxID=3031331 RepID=UPI0023DC930A|nr:N-acetyltransferase [Ramlibacter sp. H39-3-26]MDF1483803.1 N-acetyltransferase [Ramlibacter sp. H39-3-26]